MKREDDLYMTAGKQSIRSFAELINYLLQSYSCNFEFKRLGEDFYRRCFRCR